ncbi:MAG: hypothetical protein UT23_C0005G0054 [Candidatus Woesebacteria bacterium GW2011_GWA1_39_12]|uniref:Uncharacterized protein n=1 Tax=Candidatus Woesebacteria bacterium GW2011_GWA1_39_12 TaxID=1618549 RepID=A0A0G0Q8Y6_9BACT|nr:MAG: hypothetical protein UT23_C0005G0054 [Candidatus Woesebacteria bacterium GW2011_GWA1_39_12]
MEKSKTLKLIYTFLIVVYFMAVLSILGLDLWNKFSGRNTQMSPYLYWLIFVGWLAIVYRFKGNSGFSLKPAMTLLVVASLLIIFGVREIGEILMKISFVGWMVGIGQSLYEKWRSS